MNGRLVVIDPGHGGDDPGAVAGGQREADIALRYARALRAELVRRGFGAVLTHDGEGAPLYARARRANDLDAAVFVSLHCNANASSTPTGLQVFHCAGSRRGLALAEAIYAGSAAVLPTPKPWAGVYPDASPQCGDRRLYVLRGTAMPAALVELGFLTHAGDRALLTAADTPRAVASAIARGIEEYLRPGPPPG